MSAVCNIIGSLRQVKPWTVDVFISLLDFVFESRAAVNRLRYKCMCYCDEGCQHLCVSGVAVSHCTPVTARSAHTLIHVSAELHAGTREAATAAGLSLSRRLRLTTEQETFDASHWSFDFPLSSRSACELKPLVISCHHFLLLKHVVMTAGQVHVYFMTRNQLK